MVRELKSFSLLMKMFRWTNAMSYSSLCDECSKRLNEQVNGKYETPWQKVEQGREERSTPWWFDL